MAAPAPNQIPAQVAWRVSNALIPVSICILLRSIAKVLALTFIQVSAGATLHGPQRDPALRALTQDEVSAFLEIELRESFASFSYHHTDRYY